MSRQQRSAHLQPNFVAGDKAPKAPKVPKMAAPIVLTGDMPPVPEVDDIDCAFPSRWRDLLPKWEDLTKDERALRGPYCEALSSLFFSGGKLSDHGIIPKPGVELTKVMRYIRATLGDFGPPHEHKIGGIAHMLAKWCVISKKK